jgi:hypothetical protein
MLKERNATLQTNKDLVEEEKRIMQDNNKKLDDKLKRVTTELRAHDPSLLIQ